MTHRAFGALLLLLSVRCAHDHSEGHYDHDHASHHEEEGLAAVAVTVWAEQLELFMEYEPLIAGQASRFAAHLTTLADFEAVNSGTLTLSLQLGEEAPRTVRAEAPASPGIFRFEATPAKAGSCSMSLAYAEEAVSETIPVRACTVHADEAAARASGPAEGEAGVAYTKEQQWKTDFATVAVGRQPLQSSVRAVGEIRPVSGNEARLTAPARGRVSLASPTPLLGKPVKRGELLATVSPYLAAGGDSSTLAAEAQSAKAEHTTALSQVGRLERLLSEGAVPERRVEEARARVSVAKAKLDAAVGRLTQYNQGAAGIGGRGPGAFQLRAPIDGTLVEVNATAGDSVEEGRLLFVVIDLSRVWLVARVFEPDIPKAESAASAWFTLEGYDEPFIIGAANGRLITVGRVIDAASRTVPVVFEMENPENRIRIGQFAEVFIATGSPQQLLAVPMTALLDDGGKAVVFVHAEGERFERRVLRTGIRSKGWVEVTEGLVAGERVVTDGAYEVRLAAASGAIPEHGHVH